MNIYQEHILEHYSSPRNKGEIKDADIYFRDTNPLCGDEVSMYAKVSSGTVAKAAFEAKGCAISQAAASMLTEHIEGRKLAETMEMSTEEMIRLLNIPISAARTKCAVLALKALQAGIAAYKAKYEAKRGT